MTKTLFAIAFVLWLANVATIETAWAQTLKSQLRVVNRTLSIDQQTGAVHLNEAESTGIAWLKNKTFTNGTIAFDVKGKDTLQRSFVGIAFHGLNDTTYQCIYFRPFNFRAKDPVRKSHGVQYIAMPKYDWPTLREKFPNKYEQPVSPAPDPNEWFHAEIKVDGNRISVYVNGDSRPALVVQSLTKTGGKMIGYWTGFGSGADWKNLKISPK